MNDLKTPDLSFRSFHYDLIQWERSIYRSPVLDKPLEFYPGKPMNQLKFRIQWREAKWKSSFASPDMTLLIF
jgi:hypothetical protein